MTMTRRSLLRAGTAIGATACSRGAPEAIVPYVKQPPEVTPSVATLYATTMTVGGYGVGMIVESHEGRPTKAEGNPEHPASLGALGTFGQASVLALYDPSRAKAPLRAGTPATWKQLFEEVAAPPPAGKKIAVLLEPTSAPHVVDLVERVRRRGDVIVCFDSPLSRDSAWRGAKLAFGRVVEPRWDFERADVTLALDADFLGAAQAPLSWARAWASKRPRSRTYVVEARLSVTGMSADERLAVRARDVHGVAAAILGELEGRSSRWDWGRTLARDLRAHAGASAVLVGDSQPPEVHALGHAMNVALGNVGRTLKYGESPIVEAGGDSHGLSHLVRAIDAGEVQSLVVVGGDPVFTAPADLDLARRIRSVPVSACITSHHNVTARLCTWSAPEAHFLEAWSDARAFDGTPSIAQPLVRPLVDGRTAAQVLAALAGRAEASSRDLVEDHWRARRPGDFETFRQRSLVRGVVETGATPPLDVTLLDVPRTAPLPAHAPIELVYFADSKVHDGRFASIACLQELPDPVTKLTWDCAALVSPATAARLDIETQDVVELRVRDRAIVAPALVVPGMAEDVVAIALGYEQTNAYALRDSRAPWFDGVAVRKVEGRWDLAVTQRHWGMEGRPIALSRTVDEQRSDPGFAKRQNEEQASLYELKPGGEHQWGMTIDLNACTGCSACVVACTTENNVPVVGKHNVLKSREMQWLRIDRYFERDRVVVQPMLCQHCEKAPCEYVCPVNATVHSHDGLNEMVYNRCVGTRFCSNNCPYKVRRFNFFNYTADTPELLKLAMNPDVTVRARGVMEKCTYCVQRIREAEIRARREKRAMRDGDVVTACEQTCPTGAIVFGDVADPKSRVSETRRSDRAYQVLHHLGTLPRTRYLARIVNPNPELRRP